MPRVPANMRYKDNSGRSRCIICSSTNKHQTGCTDEARKAKKILLSRMHGVQSGFWTMAQWRAGGRNLTEVVSNDREPEAAFDDADSFMDGQHEPIPSPENYPAAELLWERKRATLPRYRNWKLVVGDRLSPSSWPDFRFITNNPIVHKLSSPKASESFVHEKSMIVYVICPHIFFDGLMSNVAIRCPYCLQTESVHMDGWTRGFTEVKEVGGVSLIKCRRYKCDGCTENQSRSGSFFSALHETVLASLPPVVRSCFPFVVHGRSVVSITLFNYITESRMKNQSISAMYETLKSLSFDNDMLFAKNCLELALSMKSLLGVWSKRFPGFEFPSMEICLEKLKPSTHVLGRRKLSKLFVSNTQRMEPFFLAHMVERPARALKLDHTFAIAKSIRRSPSDRHPLYSSLLTVMNEYQEVCAYYLTQTKSLLEIQVELKMLEQRPKVDVKQIYCDNPSADGRYLREVFGEDVHIFRDIFHVIQDIGKRCRKKSPWFPKFMAEVSNAFFHLDHHDVEREAARLADEQGGDFDPTSVTDAYWKRNPRIRKHVNPPDVILEAVKSSYDRFEHTDLPTPELGPFIRKLLGDLENGTSFGMTSQHEYCVQPLNAQPGDDISDHEVQDDDGEDDDVQEYDGEEDDAEEDDVEEDGDEASEILEILDIDHINVGSKDNPRYISVRSTSQLEALHSVYTRNSHGSSNSPTMGHCVLLQEVYRWNRNKARVFRRDPTPCTNDIVLLHEVGSLMDEIGIQDCERHGIFKNIKPQARMPSSSNPFETESFGCARVHHASEALSAYLEVIGSLPPPAMERAAAPLVSVARCQLSSYIQKKCQIPVLPTHVQSKRERKYFWTTLVEPRKRALEATFEGGTNFSDFRDLERSLGFSRSIYAGEASKASFAFFDDFLNGEMPSIRPKDAFHIQTFVKKSVIDYLKRLSRENVRRRSCLLVGEDDSLVWIPLLSEQVGSSDMIAPYESAIPIQTPSAANANYALPIVPQETRERTRNEMMCPECGKNPRHHTAGCRLNAFKIRMKNSGSVKATANASVFKICAQIWASFSEEQKRRA